MLRLPNTIKSEYTSTVKKNVRLSKGNHTVTLEHHDGTFVLDSLIVKPHESSDQITVLPDEDGTTDEITSYIAIAPENGYYRIFTNGEMLSAEDSAFIGVKQYIYLAEGFNRIDIQGSEKSLKIKKSAKAPSPAIIFPSEAELSGGARVENGILSGISSEGGSARFTINSDASKNCRITLSYSCNAEGGAHSYNVDLIDQYVTVTLNGEAQNIMCRNTNADDNFSSVTFNAELKKGKNEIILSNNGQIQFNNQKSYAPKTDSITIAETCCAAKK